MKKLFAVALFAGLAWVSLGSSVWRVDGAENALCRVCHVLEGTVEEEAVEEWRTYEGARYGFCSEKCAKEFDADPIAFLPPVYPRPAPELAVTTLAGDSLDWDALRGKVVLVDFWATWCTPCRKSMPELQALHEKHAARGFTVIGVSIDEDGPEKVRKFIESKKITYPIAIDSKDKPAWARFHVRAVPAAFLVDGEGQIVSQWTGVSANAREVEGKLEALLAPKATEKRSEG